MQKARQDERPMNTSNKRDAHIPYVLHRYYRINNNYLGRRERTRYLNNNFCPARTDAEMVFDLRDVIYIIIATDAKKYNKSVFRVTR